MSTALNFHPSVQREVDEAYRWYEQQRPGLGRDFLDEVGRLLAEIVSNPARFGFAHGSVREGLLTRFPYAVYYRERPGRVRVLAVYHTARDPAGWQNRR